LPGYEGERHSRDAKFIADLANHFAKYVELME